MKNTRDATCVAPLRPRALEVIPPDYRVTYWYEPS